MLTYKLLSDLNKNYYINGLFSTDKRFYFDNIINNHKDAYEEITNYEIDFDNALEFISSKANVRRAAITIDFTYIDMNGVNPYNSMKRCAEAEGVIMIKTSVLYIYLYVIQSDDSFSSQLTKSSVGINYEDQDYCIVKVEECQVFRENRCEEAPDVLTASYGDCASYEIKCDTIDSCFVCFIGDKEVEQREYLNWRNNSMFSEYIDIIAD